VKLQFTFSQRVGAGSDTVAAFFHDVANLLRVTPAFPPLRLEAPSGTRVRPGAGFTMTMDFGITSFSWNTVIESVLPDGTFTDVFRGNVFREWRHTHRFSPAEGGTIIHDEIECRPAWWFSPFAWFFVRVLFVFRQIRLGALFA
jgi:ligand-binding SRPBCC domain-containing protein